MAVQLVVAVVVAVAAVVVVVADVVAVDAAKKSNVIRQFKSELFFIKKVFKPCVRCAAGAPSQSPIQQVQLRNVKINTYKHVQRAAGVQLYRSSDDVLSSTSTQDQFSSGNIEIKIICQKNRA